MAGRLATGTLAARGAGNPEALAAFIASRARNGQQVLNFASPRYPVASPNDVLVSRTPQGTASIRHRRGGALIGEIKQGETGWQAVYDGKDLKPHSHQRGALAELLSTWNTGTASAERPAAPQGTALQPPAQQTPLMQQYGVPAIRTFAFPNTSSSSGPRTTSSDSDDDNDNDSGGSGGGLTPKGKGIYAKLKAKGWPDAKALMFAKRAQSFGGNK
jgi:hypothetical protein